MTKYIVYAEDDENPGKQAPIKKLKREYEAIEFVNDVRNLSRYGCMTLFKSLDNGEKLRWNTDTAVWELVV